MKNVIRRFPRNEASEIISDVFPSRRKALAAIAAMRSDLEAQGYNIRKGGQGTLVGTTWDGTYLFTIAAEPWEEGHDERA